MVLRQVVVGALLAAVISGPVGASTQPEAVIEEIARRWVGAFDNHRQVASNIERGPPEAPELTREKRTMAVHRIRAPHFGSTVLYFEEFKDSTAPRAHRQRVVSLVADPQSGQVRAQQWFFGAGPTYDRRPMSAAQVEQLPPGSLRRIPECDLFFVHEVAHDRYRGAMRPRACEYDHEVDGRVYADFEMLLYPQQHWYRDRSIRVRDGSVRGEIDGFSWLLFDRAEPRAMPAVARQQGVWRGVFRRYDASGQLLAEFPSEIIVRVETDGAAPRYRQTNIYRPAGAPVQRIESSGEIRDGRLWFENERLRGWSMDIQGDQQGLGAVLVMHYTDGSRQSVYEIITRSEDGRRRWRATQYFQDGKLTRRTLIDEEKVTDDWRAWDAQHAAAP
jgi:hypothetical protein